MAHKPRRRKRRRNPYKRRPMNFIYKTFEEIKKSEEKPPWELLNEPHAKYVFDNHVYEYDTLHITGTGEFPIYTNAKKRIPKWILTYKAFCKASSHINKLPPWARNLRKDIVRYANYELEEKVNQDIAYVKNNVRRISKYRMAGRRRKKRVVPEEFEQQDTQSEKFSDTEELTEPDIPITSIYHQKKRERSKSSGKKDVKKKRSGLKKTDEKPTRGTNDGEATSERTEGT